MDEQARLNMRIKYLEDQLAALTRKQLELDTLLNDLEQQLARLQGTGN